MCGRRGRLLPSQYSEESGNDTIKEKKNNTGTKYFVIIYDEVRWFFSISVISKNCVSFLPIIHVCMYVSSIICHQSII